MDRSVQSSHEVAMLQAAQSHRNVLSIIQVIEDQSEPRTKGKRVGKLYLITECMSGGNLLSFVIQNGGLTESAVQAIAFQLIQAVDHLHNYSFMCHNGLNPVNVLMAMDNTVTIADFGSSVPLDDFPVAEQENPPSSWSSISNSSPASTMSPLTSSTRTRNSSHALHRAVANTVAPVLPPDYYYRAPELLPQKRSSHDQSATPAADMWSIGAILYFCLFGHNDKSIVSHDSLLSRLHKDHPRKWSHTSRYAKQFLNSLLHMDPSVRLTAREALEHPWFAGLDQIHPPVVAPPLSTLQLLPPLSPPKRSFRRRATSDTLERQRGTPMTIPSTLSRFVVECFQKRPEEAAPFSVG
jgi:serine/threonine protein kinase